MGAWRAVSSQSETSSIQILLVNTQVLISQGLKAILELETDLQVVGIAHPGEVAIQAVEALQPDLVLMDMSMSGIEGRSITRAMHQRFPDVTVLILSPFDDEQSITDAIRAGVGGYLLTDMPADELIQAIRMAHRGYTQLAPGLIEKWMASNAAPQVSDRDVPSHLALLTPRERDVLRLIGDGSTNRAIAERLDISEGTVKTHVTHLYNRLNLRNRAQLAIYANSIYRTS